jgi:hypothetical protein
MADIHYIHRRQFLTTLAVQSLGSCPRWDAALTAYLRAQELQWGFAEWGPMGQTNNDAEMAKIGYGPGWQQDPVATAKIDPLVRSHQAEHDRWEADYLSAVYEASSIIATTPAPNVAAAVFKAQLIEIEEIWNAKDFHHDCMKIIADDFARLEGTEPHLGFDPAEWLARFQANGGCYVHTPDDKVVLMRAIHGFSEVEQAESKRLHDTISDAQLEQVHDHIRSLRGISEEEGAPASWKDRLAAYRTTREELNRWEATSNDAACGTSECEAHEAETARLADLYADAVDALMLTPAPDVEALREKLRIFDRDQLANGWHIAAKIAAQLAQDAERLFGAEMAEAA